MSLRRASRRRRASITSLIDVIFLLLLFFMLASTFSRFSEVEVAAAPDSSRATSSEKRVVHVLVEPRSLEIDGAFAHDAELPRVLADIDGDDDASLSISVSEVVTTQRLIDVLSSIAQASDIDVLLAGAA